MNLADRATWPELLCIDEVAVIYRRRVGGIRKALQARTFIPAPYLTHPYRWRKADVVRHLDGAPETRRLRRAV